MQDGAEHGANPPATGSPPWRPPPRTLLPDHRTVARKVCAAGEGRSGRLGGLRREPRPDDRSRRRELRGPEESGDRRNRTGPTSQRVVERVGRRGLVGWEGGVGPARRSRAPSADVLAAADWLAGTEALAQPTARSSVDGVGQGRLVGRHGSVGQRKRAAHRISALVSEMMALGAADFRTAHSSRACAGLPAPRHRPEPPRASAKRPWELLEW